MRKLLPSMTHFNFIDLSHTVEDGMITYKGLPAPIICDYLSREESRKFYDPGTEFQIGKIEMVANTGTYIDAPFHRFPDGKDLSGLALERLAWLPAVRIDASAPGVKAIGPSYFGDMDLEGKAVLVFTGWARHWGNEQYFEGHPFLTEEAAVFLREAGAALVGIDSHNIDDTSTRSRPVHTVLLGAEISIVEHMRGLELIPEKDFFFTAVPPKVKNFGTFPVRAFAAVS